MLYGETLTGLANGKREPPVSSDQPANASRSPRFLAQILSACPLEPEPKLSADRSRGELSVGSSKPVDQLGRSQ